MNVCQLWSSLFIVFLLSKRCVPYYGHHSLWYWYHIPKCRLGAAPSVMVCRPDGWSVLDHLGGPFRLWVGLSAKSRVSLSPPLWLRFPLDPSSHRFPLTATMRIDLRNQDRPAAALDLLLKSSAHWVNLWPLLTGCGFRSGSFEPDFWLCCQIVMAPAKSSLAWSDSFRIVTPAKKLLGFDWIGVWNIPSISIFVLFLILFDSSLFENERIDLLCPESDKGSLRFNLVKPLHPETVGRANLSRSNSGVKQTQT